MGADEKKGHWVKIGNLENDDGVLLSIEFRQKDYRILFEKNNWMLGWVCLYRRYRFNTWFHEKYLQRNWNVVGDSVVLLEINQLEWFAGSRYCWERY